MQQFFCRCGHAVYCENSLCGNCGRTLTFEPFGKHMLSLDLEPDGVLKDSDGNSFRLCSNRAAHRVCNGAVPAGVENSGQGLCSACRLNRTIPVIEGRPENVRRWRALERAKRRMLAGVSQLGLSATPGDGPPMCFDFLEDKRSHPDMLEHFVATGHKDGVITINVSEADDSQRVQQRELMGERYRTLLGHFRHEAGHFFYPVVVTDLAAFTRLFGDPAQDYASALEQYYAQGPRAHWDSQWVSAYASSHPLEDWAECFAHYLHICDAMETAVTWGMVDNPGATLEDRLNCWVDLSIQLNEMSRSLGQSDPYPFVLTTAIVAKLAFVETAILTHGEAG